MAAEQGGVGWDRGLVTPESGEKPFSPVSKLIIAACKPFLFGGAVYTPAEEIKIGWCITASFTSYFVLCSLKGQHCPDSLLLVSSMFSGFKVHQNLREKFALAAQPTDENLAILKVKV